MASSEQNFLLLESKALEFRKEKIEGSGQWCGTEKKLSGVSAPSAGQNVELQGDGYLLFAAAGKTNL